MPTLQVKQINKQGQISIGKKYAGTIEGNHLRFISLHADHDSAYKIV